jgi:hypothetical protein
MGVAYTDKVKYWTVVAETNEPLLSAIHACFTALEIPSTLYGDGYEYLLTSPQGLSCKLRITLSTYKVLIEPLHHWLDVQFASLDGPEGVVHRLRCGQRDGEAAYTSQMVASKAQVFFSTVGVDQAGFDVQGGVPFVPNPELCLLNSASCDQVSEAWWSCGSWLDEAWWYGGVRSMRHHYHGYGCWSACCNGDLVGSSIPGGSMLLVPVQHPGAFQEYWQSAAMKHYANATGNGIFVEPLIIWSSSDSPMARVRGQLYDAALYSKDAPLDAIYMSWADNTTGSVQLPWINYLHKIDVPTNRCALYLLKQNDGAIPGVGSRNYAY